MKTFKEKLKIDESLLDKDFGIHHNPTASHVHALFANKGDLRGIHSKKHGVFVWKSRDHTHDQVMRKLKRDHNMDMGDVDYKSHNPNNDSHGFYFDQDPGHGEIGAWSSHELLPDHKKEDKERARKDLNDRISGSSVKKLKIVRPSE